VLLNKASLAEFLGFSEEALSTWQSEGLPIAKVGSRGQSHEYETAAVVAWMLDRERRRARADNPKDELYRSQKRLVDLNVAERERVLVNAAEVEQLYGGLVVAMRTRLLRIPAEIVYGSAVAGENGIRTLLESAIEDALLELSKYAPA
jgi:phage terminase Nu1 subunit (DNA packaging protein)